MGIIMVCASLLVCTVYKPLPNITVDAILRLRHIAWKTLRQYSTKGVVGGTVRLVLWLYIDDLDFRPDDKMDMNMIVQC